MSAARARGIRRRTALEAGVILAAAVGVLAGCGGTPGWLEPAGSRVAVGALVVWSGCIAEPIGTNPAVLYFTVMNRGPDDDALVGVVADDVDRADIHRTVVQGRVAWMEPAAEVEIPAGRSVRFAPGGHHVMLQTSSHRLRRGTHVGVRLIFRRAGSVQVRTPVVAYADVDRLLGPGNRLAGTVGGR